MKTKMGILILLTLLSSTAFSQDQSQNVLLNGKSISENLLKMQKSSGYSPEKFNNRESSPFIYKISNMDRNIVIHQRDFSEEGLYANESGKTINKKVLDNGFYLVESIYQSWNGSDWTDNIKSSYSYYTNSNLFRVLDQAWDGSDWTNNQETDYTYDSNNNMLVSLIQTWGSSAWVNSMKTSYTYDSNNYPIEAIEQLWVSPVWTNDWKYLYYYNGNNLDEILSQKWYNSDWTDNQRALYTFGTNNNLIEVLFQYYDDTSLDWIDYMKCSYTYDGNNNMIEELWQGFTGIQWVTGWHSLYTYDENNYLIEEVDQNWTAAAWINDMRYSYSYDVNNNLIEELVQTWNGSDWLNDGKYLNTYNPLTAVDQYSNSLNSFNLSDNYPNPFNPSTKINYSLPQKSVVSLKVYDLLGSEIAELVNSEVEAGEYEVNFNAGSLPSGTYFYQLKAGDYTSTKKMLLIK